LAFKRILDECFFATFSGRACEAKPLSGYAENIIEGYLSRAPERLYRRLLVLLPISGFAFTAAIERRLGKQAHWVPVLAIGAVWVIAMVLVVQVLSGSAPLLEGSEDTHGFALTLTRQAVVLDRGRVVHRGPSADLLDDPQTLHRLVAVS